MTDPVADQLTHILAVRQHRIQIFDGLGSPALGDHVRQRDEHFLSGSAQKIQHIRRIHRLVAAGDALVQNAQAVSYRTIRIGRDDPESRFGHLNADVLTDLLHPADQDIFRDPFEIQPQTPGKNGGRQLAGLRRGQNERHIFRGFLQRLQQGVEGLRGKHVHFVDDVDLVPSHRRRIVDAVAQLADVIDTAVGGRVDLHHIQEIAVTDGLTGRALAAGPLSLRRTVQTLGKQPRRGGFAGASGSAEQVSMAGGPGGKLILQDLRDMFLAQELVKHLRPVCAV